MDKSYSCGQDLTKPHFVESASCGGKKIPTFDNFLRYFRRISEICIGRRLGNFSGWMRFVKIGNIFTIDPGEPVQNNKKGYK
jgi:hypothetical protein